MSAPQDEAPESLTTADWLRYAFLVFLGSLVWLGIFGRRTGGIASLFAVYLLLAAVVLLVVQVRRERS